MSNKLEATFHGPPPEPLPQRDPFMTLADYDGTRRAAAAELARRSPAPPPWVAARRAADAYDPRWNQVLIGMVNNQPVPPPPPPPPAPEPPVVPPSWPAWAPPVVAGAAGALVFLGLLVAVAGLGWL